MVFFWWGWGWGGGRFFVVVILYMLYKSNLVGYQKKKDRLNIIVKDVLQDIAFNIFDMFLILLFLL